VGNPASPPELPAATPQDLRDFVECRAASVTIKDGPQAWVSLPAEARNLLFGNPKPDLRIRPGPTPEAATIEVKISFVSVSLPASITSGRLAIDPTGLPGWAPASIGAALTSFVDDLNAWFEANGVGLAPPTFGAGQVSLSKVPLAPAP
jgi:hypothetical protein